MSSIFTLVMQIVVLLLIAIVAMKLIYNLLLPYAIIRHSELRSVSTFPLIEVIPLVVAILIAWGMEFDGRLSAYRLVVIGLGGLVLSYLHFFLVLMIGGYLRSRN